MKKNIFFLFLVYFSFLSHAADRRVSSIEIRGNQTTKERLVLKVMKIDTGTVLDSSVILAVKKRIKELGLFKSVEVTEEQADDGVKVKVVLVEKSYLAVNKISGELLNKKFGEKTELWWNAGLGVEYKNFRGMKEKISTEIAFPNHLLLAVKWYKPIVTTPYYIRTGISVNYYPDLYIEWERLYVFPDITFGRKTGKWSNFFLMFSPVFEKKTYKGDITDNEDILRQEEPAEILYTTLAWCTDRRNNWFDTKKGWFIYADIKTNALHPRNRDTSYVQLSTDTRLYHRGLLKDHTIAYRLRLQLRDRRSDMFDALYAGGESTLRGYPRGYLPKEFKANNSILFSTEYRFSLFRTPSFTIPFFYKFHGGLRDFFMRFDLGLFFDGAYLWNYISEPQIPEEAKGAGGAAGLGIRVILPTLRHSLCLDLAWGFDGDLAETKKEDNTGPLSEPLLSNSWSPILHAYIDLYF